VDPVLSLSPSRVEVAPGGEAHVSVTVRNAGDVVTELEVMVLGEAARWADVSPAVVSLLTVAAGPQQAEASVNVTFRPPRPPAAPAGEVHFGIRAVSREGRDECAVEEGVLVVAAVQGLETELRPVGRRGRRSGNVGLVLRNTGTVPMTVAVRAADAADRLRFAVGPPTIDVPAGETRTVYIAARPRETIWFGKAVEHQFTVSYRVRGAEAADQRTAVYEQRPAIPKWLIIVLLLIVLGLAALVAWLFLNAPEAEQNPAALGDSPPAVAGVGVSAADPGAALIRWQPSPYALSGYLVRSVDDQGNPAEGRPVKDPDQASFTWEGRSPGRSCFEVVAVGADEHHVGARGKPVCVVVAPTATPSPSASASPSPSTGATPGESPPASSEPSVPAVDPGITPGSGGEQDLQGWFVIYRSTFADDTAARKTELPKLVKDLQDAGSSAQLVEGADYLRLPDDQLHVVEDGFADRAAAKKQCDDLESIAPLCIVGPRPSDS
jgi:hypothetical protein